MRRKEKEIKGQKEIEEILNRAEICHIGLCKNNIPYVISVNFGYKDRAIYFHSAPEGRKIDIIKSNQIVSFTCYCDYTLTTEETPCRWSARYRSVCGQGRAVVLSRLEDKINGLDILMSHYANGPFEYDSEDLKHMVIVKVVIDQMTGKKSGY